MQYARDKFILESITEDLFDRTFKIYDTNHEYFQISMNENPSMASVINDKNEIPPKSSLEDKNYKLITLNDIDIGVIDYVVNYPDEDIIYIGLFMINGEFHRSGYGRMFMEEFIPRIKSQGFSRIRLGVLDQNIKAFEFWTKMGFNVVKEMFSTIHPERNWKIKVMEKMI